MKKNFGSKQNMSTVVCYYTEKNLYWHYVGFDETQCSCCMLLLYADQLLKPSLLMHSRLWLLHCVSRWGLSLSRTILCHHLHLPPAVSEARLPHFFPDLFLCVFCSVVFTCLTSSFLLSLRSGSWLVPIVWDVIQFLRWWILSRLLSGFHCIWDLLESPLLVTPLESTRSAGCTATFKCHLKSHLEVTF